MAQINPDESYKRQIAQYAAFEDRGVSLLSRMLNFVPTERERVFIESQVQDEMKHSRLFADRADELGIEEQFFNESLEKLYEIGEQCVDAKDWLRCVACQSIIEELAIASFSIFLQRADEVTKKILVEVIEDEKRHLDFAFRQIQKWTKTEKDKKKIEDLQKEVLRIFLDALNPESIEKRLPAAEQEHFKKTLKITYALHKKRFEKLNLQIPSIPMRYLF